MDSGIYMERFIHSCIDVLRKDKKKRPSKEEIYRFVNNIEKTALFSSIDSLIEKGSIINKGLEDAESLYIHTEPPEVSSDVETPSVPRSSPDANKINCCGNEFLSEHIIDLSEQVSFLKDEIRSKSEIIKIILNDKNASNLNDNFFFFFFFFYQKHKATKTKSGLGTRQST